jgi:hypothetical protein
VLSVFAAAISISCHVSHIHMEWVDDDAYDRSDF